MVPDERIHTNVGGLKGIPLAQSGYAGRPREGGDASW